VSTYLTEIDTEAPQAASTAALATQAPAGNVGDPGPAGMDERIASALTDDAVRSDAVAALLVEVEAGANAADLVAKGARDAAMDPLLSRAEVNHARQEMVDSEFDRDRLRVAAQKLATRLVELKAAENSAALRGEHQALTGERDRLVATDTLVQIGKLALAIDACEREIKRWNPLGGRTLAAYVRPVLSADLPPTLAGLFADARVMDALVGMAMSPPLPSPPSPKLRAV
jgi:hypothetical protein